MKSGSSCCSGNSWRKVFTETRGLRTSCASSCVRRPSSASRSRRCTSPSRRTRRRSASAAASGSASRLAVDASAASARGRAAAPSGAPVSSTASARPSAPRHRRRGGEPVARGEPAQCRVRSGREQRAGAVQADDDLELGGARRERRLACEGRRRDLGRAVFAERPGDDDLAARALAQPRGCGGEQAARIARLRAARRGGPTAEQRAQRARERCLVGSAQKESMRSARRPSAESSAARTLSVGSAPAR